MQEDSIPGAIAAGAIASDILTTEQGPEKSPIKKLRIKRAPRNSPFSKKSVFASDAGEGEKPASVNGHVLQHAAIIAVDATASSPAEKQLVQRRSTYYEARANPGAKLAICEEDLVAEGAGKEDVEAGAIAADAIAVEGKVGDKIQGETDVDKDDPAAILEMQEAERAAATKLAEVQATKEVDAAVVDAANLDATASEAVAVEQEGCSSKPRTKENKH